MQGVEECALNTLAEIRQCLKERPTITYLTILGHSFGGVIARNVLEKLFSSSHDPCNHYKQEKRKGQEKEDFMKNITLVDLFLIASPCIGIRRPGTNFFTSPFNSTFTFGAPIVAGETGRELLLNDKMKIIYKMTKPKFVNILEKFNRRLLYGNVFVSKYFFLSKAFTTSSTIC